MTKQAGNALSLMSNISSVSAKYILIEENELQWLRSENANLKTQINFLKQKCEKLEEQVSLYVA